MGRTEHRSTTLSSFGTPLCAGSVGTRTSLGLVMDVFVAASLAVYVLAFLSLLYHLHRGGREADSPFSPPQQHQGIAVPLRGAHRERIAMLLLYSGPSLPPFFPLFLHFAEMQKDTADWFIFTDLPDSACAFYNSSYKNVFVVHFGRMELARRIAGALAYDGGEEAILAMDLLLSTFPYALVELKPCLATVFADFVPSSSYSHWGYFDLDTAIIRLPSADEMRGVDVLTSSYGDNGRIYVRGQLTVLRNSDKINSLWRNCETLAGLGGRLRTFLSKGVGRKWRFESCEACFSKAVFEDRGNITVLIRTDQLSDAARLGQTKKRSEFTVLSSGSIYICDGRDYLFERRLINPPLRINTSDHLCSYWMNPKFALCLEAPPAALQVDILSIGNRLTATSVIPIGEAPAGCRAGSLAHFQGFKRRYYSFNTLVDLSSVERIVFTQHGVIGVKGDTPPRVQSSVARLHCLKFSSDLKSCLRPLLPHTRSTHGAYSPRPDDVTLIYMELSEHDTGTGWQGPQVRLRTCGIGGCTSFEASIGTSTGRVAEVEVDVPAGAGSAAAALYNMGLRAARTELVLLLPAGSPLPPRASIDAALTRLRGDSLFVAALPLDNEERPPPPLLSRALLLNTSGSAHGKVVAFPEELGDCRDAILPMLRGLGYAVDYDAEAGIPACGGATEEFTSVMGAYFRRCAELRGRFRET